jgi:hypothetical protein
MRILCYMNKNLLFSYIIFAILFLTAMLKILYPSPALKPLYLTVSLFELLLAATLLLFFDRWQVWALLILVFATWGGYACYTTIWDLPCSCLGSTLILPRGTSLGFNLGICGVSWRLLKGLPQSGGCRLSWLGVLSIALFAGGFLIANFILEK